MSTEKKAEKIAVKATKAIGIAVGTAIAVYGLKEMVDGVQQIEQSTK